jgi:energy-converting hydrogenase Eha subunit B
MLVYLILVRPFNTSLLNSMEIFNEGCLLLASLHVYLFTEFSPDPGFRYRVGWSLVVLTLVNLLVNVLFMLGQTF